MEHYSGGGRCRLAGFCARRRGRCRDALPPRGREEQFDQRILQIGVMRAHRRLRAHPSSLSHVEDPSGTRLMTADATECASIRAGTLQWKDSLAVVALTPARALREQFRQVNGLTAHRAILCGPRVCPLAVAKPHRVRHSLSRQARRRSRLGYCYSPAAASEPRARSCAARSAAARVAY